jgi:hypothetical protein
MALNPQQVDILSHLDEEKPKTIYDVAEETGASYWALYPNFRKLESLGLILPGIYNIDKKKTYTRTDASSTPKFHFGGPMAQAISFWELAKQGQATDSWSLPIRIKRLPAIATGLYYIAGRIRYGYEFRMMKTDYMEFRSELVTLRNQLGWYHTAISNLLEHPVMSGDPKLIEDALMNDPNLTLIWDSKSSSVREN